MKARDDRVPIWNVWWTLTMISAAFTVVVVILEYLGVFQDFGMALGVLGVIAAIIFGVSASTRSSVRTLDHRLVGVDDRRGTLDGRLAGLDSRLTGLDSRLGGLDGRLLGLDDRLAGIGQALVRIEELLRARLPAA